VPYEIVNCAGASDNRSVAGTARGWGSAHPSRIVEVFIDTQVANPIVLVDELEKAGGSEGNGRITQSLLTMLEPETRGRFYDEALSTSVDLSFVNWVCTDLTEFLNQAE
jgi:ATP-dependent Lon protease